MNLHPLPIPAREKTHLRTLLPGHLALTALGQLLLSTVKKMNAILSMRRPSLSDLVTERILETAMMNFMFVPMHREGYQVPFMAPLRPQTAIRFTSANRI